MRKSLFKTSAVRRQALDLYVIINRTFKNNIQMEMIQEHSALLPVIKPNWDDGLVMKRSAKRACYYFRQHGLKIIII